MEATLDSRPKNGLRLNDPLLSKLNCGIAGLMMTMKSAAQLRDEMTHVLLKNTRKVGLTYGELSRKCGKEWRRALQNQSGISPKRPPVEHVTKFVYDRWVAGTIFIEPPRPGQRTARVWHPDHAEKKFPQFKFTSTVPKNGHRPSTADLRAAYDRFLPEHPSGAVNIFKIRRSLDWNRQQFDAFLEKLAGQSNPPIQFVAGDPNSYSQDQRDDSLHLDSELYFSILWRS